MLRKGKLSSLDQSGFRSFKMGSRIIIIVSFFCLMMGCNLKSVTASNQTEIIVKERVNAFYESWKNGEYTKAYEYFSPFAREIAGEEFILCILSDIKILDYKIESIKIDENILAEIVIFKKYTYVSSKDKKVEEERHYTYWGYTNNNWYYFDDFRSGPQNDDLKASSKQRFRQGMSPEEIEEEKKMMRRK